MFDLSKFSLEGKCAIVTGGGRGIGKAIALGFAHAGAKVVITSRKIEELEATASQIRAFGGQAVPIQAHLGKMAGIQQMVDSAVEAFGRIDILVNNAGASPAMASVLESQERLWDTIMNLNMKGLYFISQAVSRIMKQHGGGKIINISSIDGFHPERTVSIYSISKAGVRMITKAFAAELAEFNIQVNTIAPGPVHSKMMDSHWINLTPEAAQKAKAETEALMPMGRIGDPDDIVGAAVYFASDASNYATGTEIVIDGALLLAPLLNAPGVPI
ncbi:MAG: SDR family oxidoreductase [Desulfatitalea sp.]|nr:SDR family oxidoreductase [Desulfatitalea sp.]NNJ99571.1 SDR family oxidoreductase [Desulfatitalea sp.]